MTYQPQTWANGETGGTPLSAERLNHIERGIAAAGGGMLSILAYGATGDGVTDDTPAIHAAMDAAQAVNGTVNVPPGPYNIASPILARSHVTLHLARGARLVRGFSGGQMVCNPSFYEKVHHFAITGPGTICSPGHATNTGQMVFLYGDDLTLADFAVDTYAGGQAVLVGGDRNLAAHLSITNPDPRAGVGAIRMFGGRHFRGIGCHAEAGDDALMFTPIAADGDTPIRNMSISDSAYVGCTGGSKAARFMIVALASSPPGQHNLTNSITNVSFIGCHGYGQKRGVVVTNTDSTGEIANVGFIDSSVDMAGSPEDNGQEILLERGPGAGRVRDIRLSGFRVIAPVASPFGTSGDATTDEYVEDVTLDDCMFEAPATEGLPTVKALAVKGLTLRGGRVAGNGTGYVIASGAGSNASARLTIDGPHITGIGDGWAGVHLPATDGYRVRDATLDAAEGATTSAGISLTASSVGIVDGNDLRGVATPVTGNGEGTVVGDNLIPA